MLNRLRKVGCYALGFPLNTWRFLVMFLSAERSTRWVAPISTPFTPTQWVRDVFVPLTWFSAVLVVGKCATNPQENRQVVFSLDTKEVSDSPQFSSAAERFSLCCRKRQGQKVRAVFLLRSWDCLNLPQNATANHKVDGAFVFIWQQQQLSLQTFLHFINSSNICVANATGNSSPPRRNCQSSATRLLHSSPLRPILLTVYRLSTRL